LTSLQETSLTCTKVHLDRDRSKWKVTRCCIAPNALGENFTSVSDGDMYFDDVRRELQDNDENQRIASEDCHADSQGGPVPQGAWQLWMCSTVKPMREVQGPVPDPRGDYLFGAGE
jgi:hypothetical protein